MSDQPESARPTSQYHAAVNQPQEFDREMALAFLENIFEVLLILNTAYLHMHPMPTKLWLPCEHVPLRTLTGPGHIAGVARQGERLAYIGMLLRAARHICDIRDSSSRPLEFAAKMRGLKEKHPDLAHGVAMLKFLAAGLCHNDKQTPNDLLRLVRELRSNVHCQCRRNSIDLLHRYNKALSNRILTLINILLDQCKTCGSMERVKKLKEKLGADLDPSKYNGCGDCELMLVDTLMYARMLPNAYRRMLASLRLSFDYDIDLRQVEDDCPWETVDDQVRKGIEEIASRLSELGLTKVGLRDSVSPNRHLHTKSMVCEVMFMSGRKEEDKISCKFLQNPEQRRRLFYIQCEYQYQQQQAQGDQQQQAQSNQRQPKRCCEPQMLLCLDKVALKLGRVYQRLAELVPVMLPKMRVHMMLEQDPCRLCSTMVLPDLLAQLDQLIYHKDQRPQLFTMLPYEPSKIEEKEDSPSTFLKRLIPPHGCGPVRLKDDLKPFEERHVCMIRGHCRGVRCYGHCQYSTPSNALAMRHLRHHELKSCTFKRDKLFEYYDTVPVRGAYA